MERLGSSLASQGVPVDVQIEALAATLAQAWRPASPGVRFETGAVKAARLARFIRQQWRRLGGPCSPRAVEIARAFVARRAAAFDGARAVIAHGDPHPENALTVPGASPPRYRLIDPDGHPHRAGL